jgi:hypothetical protein
LLGTIRKPVSIFADRAPRLPQIINLDLLPQMAASLEAAIFRLYPTRYDPKRRRHATAAIQPWLWLSSRQHSISQKILHHPKSLAYFRRTACIIMDIAPDPPRDIPKNSSKHFFWPVYSSTVFHFHF